MRNLVVNVRKLNSMETLPKEDLHLSLNLQ